MRLVSLDPPMFDCLDVERSLLRSGWEIFILDEEDVLLT